MAVNFSFERKLALNEEEAKYSFYALRQKEIYRRFHHQYHAAEENNENIKCFYI